MATDGMVGTDMFDCIHVALQAQLLAPGLNTI